MHQQPQPLNRHRSNHVWSVCAPSAHSTCGPQHLLNEAAITSASARHARSPAGAVEAASCETLHALGSEQAVQAVPSHAPAKQPALTTEPRKALSGSLTLPGRREPMQNHPHPEPNGNPFSSLFPGSFNEHARANPGSKRPAEASRTDILDGAMSEAAALPNSPTSSGPSHQSLPGGVNLAASDPQASPSPPSPSVGQDAMATCRCICIV